MTRAQIWLQYLANLLVCGTGAVYLVMKHLLASDDPFAVVNHPAQPLMQHLHVVAAPLLIFVSGYMSVLHVLPNARRVAMPRWRSGMLLLVSFVPMAASGYLLQVSVETTWRTIWLWTHLASSAMWVLGSATHLGRPSRDSKAAAG